jgi:hypothetical protein
MTVGFFTVKLNKNDAKIKDLTFLLNAAFGAVGASRIQNFLEILDPDPGPFMMNTDPQP